MFGPSSGESFRSARTAPDVSDRKPGEQLDTDFGKVTNNLGRAAARWLGWSPSFPRGAWERGTRGTSAGPREPRLNDIIFSEPCVVFALRREAMYFRKQFEPEQRVPGAPCWAAFCGPEWLQVVVLETGLGAAAMETAIQWLLKAPLFGNVPLRPKLVLLAGFSGALRPGQRVGDLVLATEVADQDGNVWPATWPGELAAPEWKTLARGRILTVPALIAEPAMKRSLGERFGAAAVDMESAALARLCHQRGVPFGCLRAISDDLDTPLSPHLGRLLRRGRVSPWRLALALARHPLMAGELWRLAGATRHAARELSKALGALLTLTLDWMGDGEPAA